MRPEASADRLVLRCSPRVWALSWLGGLVLSAVAVYSIGTAPHDGVGLGLTFLLFAGFFFLAPLGQTVLTDEGFSATGMFGRVTRWSDVSQFYVAGRTRYAGSVVGYWFTPERIARSGRTRRLPVLRSYPRGGVLLFNSYGMSADRAAALLTAWRQREAGGPRPGSDKGLDRHQRVP